MTWMILMVLMVTTEALNLFGDEIISENKAFSQVLTELGIALGHYVSVLEG